MKMSKLDIRKFCDALFSEPNRARFSEDVAEFFSRQPSYTWTTTVPVAQNRPIEYKVVGVDSGSGGLETFLNNFGKEGWKLAQWDGSTAILSRFLEYPDEDE